MYAISKAVSYTVCIYYWQTGHSVTSLISVKQHISSSASLVLVLVIVYIHCRQHHSRATLL